MGWELHSALDRVQKKTKRLLNYIIELFYSFKRILLLGGLTRPMPFGSRVVVTLYFSSRLAQVKRVLRVGGPFVVVILGGYISCAGALHMRLAVIL